VGATFVIDDDLRGWIDKLADRAIAALDDFEKGAI
jgi:hypothetical protein